eukprot:scpid107754/ scgid34760/ 
MNEANIGSPSFILCGLEPVREWKCLQVEGNRCSEVGEFFGKCTILIRQLIRVEDARKDIATEFLAGHTPYTFSQPVTTIRSQLNQCMKHKQWRTCAVSAVYE